MKFEDYTTHEEESVREVEGFLVQAKTALDAGEMSRSEFDEIAEDLLQLKSVEAYANDLEHKIKLQEVFSVLRDIASFIPI